MTKSKNIIILGIYLCSVFLLPSCGTSKSGQTPTTVKDAETARAKKKAIDIKNAKKAQKQAKKAFWKKQSKQVRKRVKKTNKKRKKEMRRRKRRKN